MVLPAVGGGVCGLIEGRNSSGSLGTFYVKDFGVLCWACLAC